jgi:hypothetical protein
MFSPSVQCIRYNYTKLNKLLFNNFLPKSKDIDITFFPEHYEDDWAWCTVDKKSFTFKFALDFDSRKHFLDILAHEMIHLAQHISDGKMNHQESFFTWKEKFDYYGFDLQHKY